MREHLYQHDWQRKMGGELDSKWVKLPDDG